MPSIGAIACMFESLPADPLHCNVTVGHRELQPLGCKPRRIAAGPAYMPTDTVNLLVSSTTMDDAGMALRRPGPVAVGVDAGRPGRLLV